MMKVNIIEKYLKEHLVYLCQMIFGFFLYVNRKLWKAKKINQDRIVIFSLHKLGDAVFTIPAITRIQKYSNSEITIFCFEELRPIYQIVFNNIDFCTVKHFEFNFGGRIARSSARNKLSMLNPKIIIDLTGAITTASLLITSRATKIIGMNKEYYRKLYDSFTSISYTSHLRDIYLNVSNLFDLLID